MSVHIRISCVHVLPLSKLAVNEMQCSRMRARPDHTLGERITRDSSHYIPVLIHTLVQCTERQRDTCKPSDIQ